MLLGYNTNGLAHHDPFAAVELLADLGYRSVALTLDHGPLDPFGAGFAEQLARMRHLLVSRGLASVVETGARFLLDARVKHEPTLVSANPAARARRVDFYRRAIDAAAVLQSHCVSLWSGTVHDGAGDEEALDRLGFGLRQVLDYAADHNVIIGFEPEPGMLIDTMAHYDRLLQWIDSPNLRLTLDVGHLYCQGEVPLADYIRRYGDRVVNVHLEDMKAGVHEHLMFGQGEIRFPPVIESLAGIGYAGGVHVELSRHSHEGPAAARQAYDFLAPLWQRYVAAL